MAANLAKMLEKRVTTCAIALALAASLPAAASAQLGDGQGFAMGSGRMVRGTVTAEAPDHLTIKTEAGDVYEIVTTPNTRILKGRDPFKLADIHTGDAVGAMGEVDAARKTVHALMVSVVDAEAVKKAREAMGKTVISGTVTAIDGLKITVKRTDDIVQVITVDEDTSFKKGARGMAMALAADGTGAGMGGGMGRGQRAGAAPAPATDSDESLTLADVKVGSVVAGPGTIKNGIFVPSTLSIGEAAAPRQRRRPDGATGTPPATSPATTTPATTTPASPNSGPFGDGA